MNRATESIGERTAAEWTLLLDRIDGLRPSLAKPLTPEPLPPGSVPKLRLLSSRR